MAQLGQGAGLDEVQVPPIIITPPTPQSSQDFIAPKPDIDDPMQGPLPALTTEAVPEAVHTSAPSELFAA